MTTVTQADREAAKSLLGRDDAGPSWWSIDSGNADNDPLVQAFVRHRIAAEQTERANNYKSFTDGLECAAQICGSLAETTYDDADGFQAATGCEAAIMAVVKDHRREQAAIGDYKQESQS